MRTYHRDAPNMRLTSLDLAVIIAYLAGITLFGIAFRRGQSTVRDYFLGGRTAPWWALALSIVATETSTLTIVGTPALAFAGNLTFLQFVFGYLVGRVVIVLLFLPHYFRGEYYTAYQLMERRFGAKVKAVAASTFLVTRVLAEGVRVAAIALVVTAALGTGQRTSILLIMALVLIYTFEGGMKAVIWTDVVQFILYFSGSLAAFFLLLHRIPGGWETIVHAAAPAHKFRIFDFSFSLTNPAKLYTFWSGVIGGTFFTMGSHGTDQTIVQRLLAAKSERESKLALLASGVVILLQFALFLVLGVMLYAWHGAPAVIAGHSYDSVFPDFIVTAMPSGARGAILAAIIAVAMSNASGSLNSLAASSVVDFQHLRGLRDVGRKSRTPAAPFAMDDAGLGNRARCPWHSAMGTDARSGIDHRRHHSRKPARTFLADFPFSASNGSRSPHRHVRGARSNSLRPLSNAALVDLVRSTQRGHHFSDRRARESRNRIIGHREVKGVFVGCQRRFWRTQMSLTDVRWLARTVRLPNGLLLIFSEPWIFVFSTGSESFLRIQQVRSKRSASGGNASEQRI